MAAVAVREAEEGKQVEIDRLQQALDRKDRLAIAAAMEVDEQHKLEVQGWSRVVKGGQGWSRMVKGVWMWMRVRV